MPPLNIDITQILLHVLNLVILVGGLTLILYRPVTDFLRKRRESFAEEERLNAETKAENERLKTEYETKLKNADEEIKARRAEAEREIADTASRYMDDAKVKADAIIKSAEQEAEARKVHVLESAQTEIGEMVLSATQKLLADSASPDKDSKLYDEFIKQTKRPAEKVSKSSKNSKGSKDSK